MIRRVAKLAVLSAVAATGLNLTALAPAGAAPGSPVANGIRCGFTSVTDPTLEGEAQTGEIDGGPIAAATPGASITLTCTIQVGAANSTHAGADSCTAENGPNLQVAAVPPTLCSYDSPEGQPVYMCTEVTINGTTWFWDATIVAPGPPETAAGWTMNSAALCNEAISQEIFPGPFTPVLDLIDEVLAEVDTHLNPIEQIVDGAICSTLGGLAPGVPGVVDITPAGDVSVLGVGMWDCPPYDDLDSRFIDLVPVPVVLGPGTNSGSTPPEAPMFCYYVEVRVIAQGGSGTATGTATCDGLVASSAVTAPGTGYDSAIGADNGPGLCSKAADATAEPVTVICTFWLSPFAP